jgi:hypothetical protein
MGSWKIAGNNNETTRPVSSSIRYGIQEDFKK